MAILKEKLILFKSRKGIGMSKNVLVPIAEGIEELEAITIIDILRRARANVTVASLSDDLAVTASRGCKLVADAPIAVCVENRYDLIVVPGGMPGAENLRDSKELTMMLKRQACEGGLYAAICASPAVVLAHHGLLEGKRATCYPSMVGSLGDNGTAEQRVVVDGNCVTSQGPGTAMEFALKLVEMLMGEAAAIQVGDGLLFKK